MGTGTKVVAVAVTVAALSMVAAYWAFDLKPADVAKYFSQPSKEEQGAPFDLVGKRSQVPESRGKNSSERPPTESKPKAFEESSSMLQVSSSFFYPFFLFFYIFSCSLFRAFFGLTFISRI